MSNELIEQEKETAINDLYNDRLQQIIAYDEKNRHDAELLSFPKYYYIFETETTKFWTSQLTRSLTKEQFQKIMEGLQKQAFEIRLNVDKLKEEEQKQELSRICELQISQPEKLKNIERSIYSIRRGIMTFVGANEDYQTVYSSINAKLKECLDIITNFTETKGE